MRTKGRGLSRRTKFKLPTQKAFAVDRRTKHKKQELPSYHIGDIIKKEGQPKGVIVDDRKIGSSGQYFTILRLKDGFKARNLYTNHELWVLGYLPVGRCRDTRIDELKAGLIQHPRRQRRLARERKHERQVRMRVANIRGKSRRTK